MNLITILLAVVAIVPQPTKVVEKDGVCAKCEIKYVADAGIPAEGYKLMVTSEGITVTASDEAGKFYAGETLKQLAKKVGKGTVYPCVEIEDAPAFKYRGIHFDDCRHFFGKEVVKKTMDIMAMHKMNRFHWHLTEDQGWRLDIPGYPELVKYGAVRSESVAIDKTPRAWLSYAENEGMFNGEKYGPFYYTEADIKEIVAYAAARHIQIIPEIELPGHVFAALAAYPEFACKSENLAKRDPRVLWGIEKDVLCLGNEKAVKFMEDVLDYVCKLFPGDIVHIGGDECPSERWKDCAKCQAKIKAIGGKDEHDLQPWATRHFVKFLTERGKRVLGWEEYLLGEVPQDAIGMSWRASSSGGAGHKLITPGEAAAKGHDMVITRCLYCYLDYSQGVKDDPYLYIGLGADGKYGRTVTLAKSYSLDPYEGVAEKDRAHILGGQGNNWSEYTWNRYDLEWKMWPRACALAEVFWTGEKRPGYEDFRKRMEEHRARLIRARVNCAPLD